MENKTKREIFDGAGFGLIVAGVIIALLFISVPPVSAATATVPVSGNIQQSISLTAAGTATGQSFHTGENLITGITLHRVHNTPIKLIVTDGMSAGTSVVKPETARGKLALFEITNNRFGNPANPLATPIDVAYNGGAYHQTTQAEGATLASSLPSGDVTDTITLHQTILFSDVIAIAGVDYRMFLQFDTVPA